MIYCVVPEALAPELLEQLTAYYEGDPHVEVIVDRRRAERRGAGAEDGATHRRALRDRRRPRVPGEFPPLDPR